MSWEPEYVLIGRRNPSVSSESTWDEPFEEAAADSRPSWSWLEVTSPASTRSDGNSTQPAASTPLAATLAQKHEWYRFVLVGADGTILLQYNFGSAWVKGLDNAVETLFRSREDAMRAGLELGSRHYDVHCWYPLTSDRYEPRISLVYGRRGSAISGEGFGLGRREDGLTLLVLFRFPVLTAEAVATMRTFLRHCQPDALAASELAGF